MKKDITLNVGLCEGRHNIPQVTDGYIFPSEVNPTDLIGLNNIASDKIIQMCEKFKNSKIKLNLYVTGLTVALIELLNVCKIHDLEVTLYHYNKETNDYFPQKVMI